MFIFVFFSVLISFFELEKYSRLPKTACPQRYQITGERYLVPRRSAEFFVRVRVEPSMNRSRGT